jgi:protein O-mannosyl-transferase
MPTLIAPDTPASSALAPLDRFRSSRSQPAFLALILVLVSLALYLPAGRHPFFNYDDSRYIFDNGHVKFGLSWDSVKWAFTSFDESNWHPVTWLSHMADCDLFALNPAGPHYVNVSLHALNAALLFWVLYSATGFLWRSFIVGALFALHPINVESVAWIAERKNLLSLFFFLGALGAYTWYARNPGVKRYVAVAVLFALGLMSKPQVISLPFVLLLWDYWPLQRFGAAIKASLQSPENRITRTDFKHLFLEKLPFFFLCVPSAILTMKAQMAAGAVTPFSRYPLSVRLANAVVSYAKYLGKALWPANLCVMYLYRAGSLTALQVSFSVLILLSVTFAVAASKRRYLLVGWLWFLGTLVPMIGIIQVGVQSMADRYAYLPFLGLFIAASWGLAEFAGDHRVPGKWLAVSCIALLAALAFVSHRQIGYWSSDLALWSRTAAVTTDNYVAEDGIGNALLEQGDLDAAMPHYRRAAAIRPNDTLSNLNLAFYKSQHGDLPGALAQYKTVAETALDERSRANAFANMGALQHQLGHFAAARDDFREAVKLRPRNVRAWVGLGAAAQRLNDCDTALDAFSHAVELQPSDITYLFLAGALKQSGRTNDAAAATQSARSLSQNIADAQQFVSNAVGDGGKSSLP